MSVRGAWPKKEREYPLTRTKNLVQLWSMKNYHYYLKQELYSHDTQKPRFRGFKWHPEDPLSFYIICQGTSLKKKNSFFPPLNNSLQTLSSTVHSHGTLLPPACPCPTTPPPSPSPTAPVSSSPPSEPKTHPHPCPPTTSPCPQPLYTRVYPTGKIRLQRYSQTAK